MDVAVSGRNVRVTDEVRAAVVQKIGALDRFVSGLDRAEVVFKEEKNPRIANSDRVEVSLEGHGHHLRCKCDGPDQLAAVDVAVSKLEKQLRKLKTRVVKRHRPNAHRDHNHHPLSQLEYAEDGPTVNREATDVVEAEADYELPSADLVEHKIVRRKSFEMGTMDPDTAVLRMELLDHEFFLFCNAESGLPSVVYRRDDGDFGLIEVTA